MGIEPTQPAWKAGILPLNYARIRQTTNLTEPKPPSRPKTKAHRQKLGEAGFEPAKTNVTRFTVWPLWPLGYSPSIINSIKTKRNLTNTTEERPIRSQKLAEGLEPTTTGLQNRSSAN